MSHLQLLPEVYNRVDPLSERFLDVREKLRWMMAMGGERCLLYQYPWTGTFSPYYNQATGTVQISNNDLIGYGTPYVGGYLGPFEVFVSFMTAASPITTTYTSEGARARGRGRAVRAARGDVRRPVGRGHAQARRQDRLQADRRGG